jgi:hypothetical protein
VRSLGFRAALLLGFYDARLLGYNVAPFLGYFAIGYSMAVGGACSCAPESTLGSAMPMPTKAIAG